MTLDGVVISIAGGIIPSHQDGNAFTAGFDIPISIAMNASGEAFVTDFNSHSVRKLTPSNTVAQTQSITFVPIPDLLFQVQPISLIATTTSGLPVEFEVVSGSAVVVGNQLNLLGAGLVTIRAIQPGNVYFLPAAPVERSFVVGENYTSWLRNKFEAAELENTGISGPNADPDSDGHNNLLEYALGSHPDDSADIARPVFQRTGNTISLSYRRLRGDIVYVVQHSANLRDWFTIGIDQDPDTPIGQHATATMFVPPTTDRIFLRLHVTSP
jgi:hypothetical protein